MFPMNHSRQRGDVSVYLALMMVLIMVSAVLVLNAVLTKQIRLTHDVVATERALYAANSGLEEIFYALAVQKQSSYEITTPVSIPYDTAAAFYTGTGTLLQNGEVCAAATGTYGAETRRLAVGTANCPAGS